MATLNKFTIRNFKGIQETSIELNGRTNSKVITLIGLNESGKTTILDALSNFVTTDQDVAGLFTTENHPSKNKPQSNDIDLIPISKQASFSEDIEIEATVQLEELDINEIIEIARRQGAEVDIDRLKQSFGVTRRIQFENSVSSKPDHIWEINIFARKLGTTQFVECDPEGEWPKLWKEAVSFVRKDLPIISYFPTFLVEIPDKIYLKAHPSETSTNRHYRSIIQSIMESSGDGLDLSTHVCERIDAFAAKRPNTNWPAELLMSPEVKPIDAVFQKASLTITKEVIGGWNKIFSKDSTAKKISLQWKIDTENFKLPFASFIVSDGESNYEISQRSLGFRWFFSFLLFTLFKSKKHRKNILIFDEPAANLHAKAQSELLRSFDRITHDGTKIIYSTHSHHMINPRWLSGAYIVENTESDIEQDEELSFKLPSTNIRAKKYRQFLSDYPSRSSYFQPVIESLAYVAPEIVGTPPFVVVEGISDYYALKLAQLELDLKLKFNLLPGVGSGSSDNLINLMMGRGEQFVVLLDDDKAGRKEFTRYTENWLLNKDNVITLLDIDPEYQGYALESLLDHETVENIKAHYNTNSTPSKKQIGLLLAERLAESERAPLFSKSTLSKLEHILNTLDGKFI